MARDHKMFTLGGIVKAHSLDDVQSRLLLDVEDCMNALCPDTGGRPPEALNQLHLAICLLCDWTSRSDRGRARLRERYLAIIENMEQELTSTASNMEQELTSTASNMEQETAIKVVPALLRSVIEEDDRAILDPTEIADGVEAWLAGQ